MFLICNDAEFLTINWSVEYSRVYAAYILQEVVIASERNYVNIVERDIRLNLSWVYETKSFQNQMGK